MYSHSPDHKRVDVVDLDPYGTAAPFVDAAVQCITDGGMPLPTNSRRIYPQVFRGGTRPFVRDVYGPLCLGHQQLSGEMVGLVLNASCRQVLKPNRSYSNYGGVSAKAEYSHEVVSRRTRPYFRVVIGFF